MTRRPPSSTLFPYTTLFRSEPSYKRSAFEPVKSGRIGRGNCYLKESVGPADTDARSEEHTSELQSPYDLVCRLLLEKKKKKKMIGDGAIVTNNGGRCDAVCA